MKNIWLVCVKVAIVSLVIVRTSGQDDDYDTDPEDAVESNDYATATVAQPDFFKNAFADNAQSTSRQTPYMTGSDAVPWNQYMQYFPFGALDGGGDGRSSPYSPFYSAFPMTGPAFEESSSQEARSKPANDDFFSSSKEKDNSDHFDSPPSSSAKQLNHNGYGNVKTHSHRPMMFNYGFPSPYGTPHAGLSPAGSRFNPIYPPPSPNQMPYGHQPQQHMHPIGAHTQPYAQRNKKDNFEEELQKMGINLEEFGLGGGSGGDSGESQNQGEEEKKEKKRRRKKKDKKRPLLSTLMNTFKTVQTTTTESPTQHQYLKSNVENDISNLGFNMDNYGIKEHKIEKQVYGGDRYRFPMQAIPTSGLTNGYRQNPDSTMAGYNGELSELTNFNTLNNLNQYSENKLNNLLQLDPTHGDQTAASLLPLLNSPHSTLNPVFTAADSAAADNQGDIAAINLLENSLNDLGSYRGKAHEYHHTNNNQHRPPPSDNINMNFKAFVPSTSVQKQNHESPPKFLEDDFFKDKKPKSTSIKSAGAGDDDEGNGDDDDGNDEPAANNGVKNGRKVVYKLNSEVKSNKYFESVTPKSKTTYSSSSTSTSDDDDEDGARYSKSPKYGDTEKNEDSKPITYSKEYSPTKHKFGYRFYAQNTHPDEHSNKKGESMSLVKANGESSGEKSSSGHDATSNDDQSSGGTRSNEQSERDEDGHSDSHADSHSESHSDSHADKSTNYGVEHEDASNSESSVSTPREQSNSSSSSGSGASEENNSVTDDDKVDEEFSGSRRRRQTRSLAKNDYFRSVDHKSVNHPKSMSRRSQAPVHTLAARRRQDMYDNDFEDNEEEPIEEQVRRFPKPFHGTTMSRHRSGVAFQDNKKITYQTPLGLQRRRQKIVSFDEPPINYAKRNFDTATSLFGDEEFDPMRTHTNRSKAPYFKSLKDEYDDEYNYNSPKVERRKCSGSHRRPHRVYSRDDTDFYNRLSKSPIFSRMYKNYQHL